MAQQQAGALLEREQALSRLLSALQSARDGSGGAMLVEGPAGIGKTALLDAIADAARGSEMRVLRARGGELERGLSFGLARDLLSRAVAGLPADALVGPVAVALPALGAAGREQAAPDPLAVQHGLTWLLADLAERVPAVVIADDLHWADAETAAWLVHLARRAHDLSVAVILGARPPTEPEAAPVGALRLLPEIEHLELEPLSRSAVGALVRTFYAADADDAFISACAKAAGGNPFYTNALLDAAAEKDLPPSRAGAAAILELAPDAVKRSVDTRLRTVGSEAAALARGCAVLGEAAELRHAADLAELETGAAGAAADALAAQHVLTADRPLQFVHPVVARAVRDGIPAGARAALHRRAAALFRGEGDLRRACVHLLEVEPAGREDVVADLVAAAEEALASGAPAHAARLFERALAEPPPRQEGARLLTKLGRARMAAGAPGALDTLLQAVAQTAHEPERAALLCDAAWAALWERPEEVIHLADLVAALSETSGDARLRATAAVETASRWAGYPGRAPSELLDRAERVRGETPGERELLAVALLACGVEPEIPAERLLPIGRRALSAPAETPARAVWTAADCMTCIGAPAEALPAVAAALDCARNRGDQPGVEGLLQTRVLALLLQGELRDAEVEARVLWGLACDQSPGSPGWAIALGRLFMTLALRGLVDEGKALAAEHGPFPRASGAFVYDLLQLSASWVASEAGDVREAADSMLAFEEALIRRGMADWRFTWHRPAAVEALVRLGDVDAARPLAEKEMALAEKLGDPGARGWALRATALLVDRPNAINMLQRAATLVEAAGQRERLARTLVDLGRAIRHDGRPTDARPPLRRAVELAERCGAELVAERALEELRATGAKPRRRSLRGPGSLTPSEARVARLAAAGRTNREIAQTLFVTQRTVETHLSHIYAKLEIGGRAELAPALDRGSVER